MSWCVTIYYLVIQGTLILYVSWIQENKSREVKGKRVRREFSVTQYFKGKGLKFSFYVFLKIPFISPLPPPFLIKKGSWVGEKVQIKTKSND